VSEENVNPPTGWASIDWSPRRGIQTYAEVYGSGKKPDEGIRLRDILEQLGDELREAEAATLKAKKPAVIKVKECSVELGLTWEAKGDGGVEFWVFKLGAEVSRSESQTITVTLEPTRDIAYLVGPRMIDPDAGLS
jgi:NTP-dependent ternary system trypsin peptidase co-occuring protein